MTWGRTRQWVRENIQRPLPTATDDLPGEGPCDIRAVTARDAATSRRLRGQLTPTRVCAARGERPLHTEHPSWELAVGPRVHPEDRAPSNPSSAALGRAGCVTPSRGLSRGRCSASRSHTCTGKCSVFKTRLYDNHHLVNTTSSVPKAPCPPEPGPASRRGAEAATSGRPEVGGLSTDSPWPADRGQE